MSINHELLELAAIACGIPLVWSGPDQKIPRRADTGELWNPLDDDGDALRLAVQLCLWIHIGKYHVSIEGMPIEETRRADGYSATRLAIVRAAADIGRKMQKSGVA